MMEESLVLHKSNIIIDKKVRTNFNGNTISPEIINNHPVIDYLISEGGENFLHYLCRVGLSDEYNIHILTSRHQYYDRNDFKGLKTLIILKRLNRINHLDSLLHIVCHVLNPKTNFIGCFSDMQTQKSTELSLRKYENRINFLESKTDIEIGKTDMSRLLESHGFRVMDMTEINGLTYFRAQN